MYQDSLKGQKGVYKNLSGDPPSKSLGHHTIGAVWPGSAGTDRNLIGQQLGEIRYSPDHYGTFRRSQRQPAGSSSRIRRFLRSVANRT